MRRTLKCVMLDFGGTMMYLRKPFEEILNEGNLAVFEFVREHGADVDFGEYTETGRRIFSTFKSFEDAENRDIPDTEKYYAVASELFPGITAAETKKISHTMSDLFWDIVSKYQLPSRGLADVLEKLRNGGKKLGIVSNHHNGAALRNWLSQENFDRFFDAVVVSSEVGFRKPDIRIFNFALNRLGALPGETLFVGDDIRNDITGARTAGMEAVLFCAKPADSNGYESAAKEHAIKNFRELLDII